MPECFSLPRASITSALWHVQHVTCRWLSTYCTGRIQKTRYAAIVRVSDRQLNSNEVSKACVLPSWTMPIFTREWRERSIRF